MKEYNEILEDQNKIGQKYQNEQSNKVEKLADRKWFNKVLGIFLNSIKQFTYSVKVTNEKDLEPAIKNVEKAVREIPETEVIDPRPEIERLLKAVQSLNLAVNVPETKIPDNKKELLSIEKAVKGIKIPEVKVEKTVVDFSSVIKALEGLKKSIVVPDIKNDSKTQKDLIAVLVNLESGLKNIESRLVEVRDKENPLPADNTKAVLAGLKDVKTAIKSLRFPVATFNTQPIIDAINNMSVNIGDIEVQTTGLATSTNQTSGDQKTRLFGTNTNAESFEVLVKEDISLSGYYTLAVTDDKVGEILTSGSATVGISDPDGISVNPAISENQDTHANYVLYATEYGATYNYIMRYQRGTTNWEIQRETISTGVRDYASGDSALATVWTNRATQTYGGAV
jgi:hypothetical protein